MHFIDQIKATHVYLATNHLKRQKSLHLFAACFLFFFFHEKAAAQQLYNTSAGIRLGHTSGLTYKTFVREQEAVEVLVGGRNEGVQLHLMYLFHRPMELSFNDRFYAHYGVGGHLGYERFDGIYKVLTSADGDQFDYERKSFFVMGADLSVGVEYRWLEVPASLGFDVKPYLHFAGMQRIQGRFWDAAISFKYIF